MMVCASEGAVCERARYREEDTTGSEIECTALEALPARAVPWALHWRKDSATVDMQPLRAWAGGQRPQHVWAGAAGNAKDAELQSKATRLRVTRRSAGQ